MSKAKLKKRARKTEEKIKQEEMAESSSLDAFVTKHKNLLIGGAGILVLAILGMVGMRYLNQQKNEEASALMFHAVKYFEADSLDKALNGDPDGNMGLLAIEEEYGATPAGNMARYYLGLAYLKKGELEEGITYLKKADIPSDNMLFMAKNMAIAFAYEDMGDPETAADYFERAAAAVGENDFTTPMMLMHAGRNYEAAGQPSKALRLYERIKKDFPRTQEGRQIDKYIGRVKP